MFGYHIVSKWSEIFLAPFFYVVSIGTSITERGITMQLTKNFSKAELECPCCQQIMMHQKLLVALQSFRDDLDRPFRINSGYRCEEHNRKIGGAKNSKHVIGCAVDISIVNWEPDDIHRLLYLATGYEQSPTGIGVYPTFIHFDVRDENTLWAG